MNATASKEARMETAGQSTGATAMTRRRLLAGTGQVALFALLPTACAPVTNTPWADGTFWDDGQGWTT
ncbi:MAG: hypothetical protein AAF543_17260 [Pseudomonadota bacterium]